MSLQRNEADPELLGRLPRRVGLYHDTYLYHIGFVLSSPAGRKFSTFEFNATWSAHVDF